MGRSSSSQSEVRSCSGYETAIPQTSNWHLSGMQFTLNDIALRTPTEPSPHPVREPPAPPENPDVPVREPDPTEPAQI